MKKYSLVLVILVFIGALLLGVNALEGGRGSSATASLSGDNTITIGAIMILSGEGASWGESSRNGMELAIKDINEAGGVNGKQLRGIYEDDGSDPKQAVSAFYKLTDSDKARFIIGPNWSNTGLAVAPLADAAKVVVISPSLGVKDFNESSPYLFNTWQHDDILSSRLADIVYEDGHRTVALFGANDVWVKTQTEAFRARFEALGGTIAFVTEPTIGTTDLRADVQKVVANPSIDAVVMTTDGTGLTVVGARQLKDLGVTLPLYNITVDKSILAECAAACNGMVFPTSLTPTADFQEKYEAAYDREVEIGADSAYDAVMLLAKAMKETGSEDPEKVKEYLAGIKSYDGASGLLTSDEVRGFTKPYVLMRSENGVPVLVK